LEEPERVLVHAAVAAREVVVVTIRGSAAADRVVDRQPRIEARPARRELVAAARGRREAEDRLRAGCTTARRRDVARAGDAAVDLDAASARNQHRARARAGAGAARRARQAEERLVAHDLALRLIVAV